MRDPQISVCVCAYRRPDELRKLLDSLISQVPSTPVFEVIVVDNDAAGSSAGVTRDFADARVDVRYFIEPRQNIARARNRSLAEARAGLVATIDDDEIAEPTWLQQLYLGLTEHGADVVFGPVLARFTKPPPQWIIDGGFFDYAPLATGATVPVERTRTSNALIRRTALPASADCFDERFGLTGGSDTDLFRRMLDNGARMIAVASAVVHESIAPNRLTLRWLAARWFRYGTHRLGILETRRGPRHLMVTIREAVCGLARNLWGAIRHARRRGASRIQLVHACYYLGVIAGAAGIRYREYG